MNIDTMEKLDLTVEIIFEKAVLEPAFSQTYANLCKVSSRPPLLEHCVKYLSFLIEKLTRIRKMYYD